VARLMTRACNSSNAAPATVRRRCMKSGRPSWMKILPRRWFV
jgi:hypothetical protein